MASVSCADHQGRRTDSAADQYRQQIARLLKQAHFLLDTATQTPIREQVLLATRNLDEGLMWLQHSDVDARLPFLTMADLSIRLADLRLELVRTALTKYGVDATALG
ncbi:MAG: hypothetical protein ACXW34_11080 [Nitrospira sp.]